MPPNPLAASLRSELLKYPGLDPNAVLAVAGQEGLGGGIGDQGTSFGPFQLHQGGAYPTFAPQQAQQAQAWASSPAGIDYALGRIAQVSRGLHGAQAVRAIVSQFERPADPTREIAGALGAYGGGLPSADPALSPTPVAAVAPPPQPNYRAQLLQALAGTSGNDLSGFYSQLHGVRQALAATPLPAPAGEPAPVAPLPLHRGQVLGNTAGENPGFLAKLAALAAFEHAPVDINSGYRSTAEQARLYANRASNPNPVAPPGHSLHQRGLAADGTVGGVPLGSLPAALLARFGLATVPGDRVHIQILR